MRLSLIIIILFCCYQNTYALVKSDSTIYDSLQLTDDVRLNNSQSFKTYHSEESWFKSGYNNAISNVIGKGGIMNFRSHTSSNITPRISFRGPDAPNIILNGIPLRVTKVTGSPAVNGLLDTELDYISPLEISNISILKGSKASSYYGNYGYMGAIMYNSASLNPLGLNTSFFSGYSNGETRDSKDKFDNLKNGISIAYGHSKVSSNFVVEYSTGKAKDGNEAKQKGYYLSNSSIIQINKNFRVTTYLNKYNDEIYADNLRLENDRTISSLNMNYDVENTLFISSGVSFLGTERNSSSINTKRKSTSFFLQTNFIKQMSNSIGTNLLLGIRKRNNRIVSQPSYEINWDINYLYGDFSLDYKKILYFGYSINGENDSSPNRISAHVNYSSLYTSFIFTDFIKTNFLSRGLIRANTSSIGNGTKTYELGTELNFLKGKLNVSATYFRFKEDLEEVTGFSGPGNTATNIKVGELSREAVEIELTAQPTKFWKATINWANLKQKVPDNFDFRGRNDLIVISSNKIGDPNPDWNLFLYNDFKFNKISGGFLFSYRRGGGVPTYMDPGGFNNGSYIISDASGLVLRNLYLNYTLQNLWKLDQMTIGISTQNIWAKTKYEDNYIFGDYVGDIRNSGLHNYLENVRSINFNLKIDL